MSTSMLSLTPLIWGICRTLGVQAFEPLISGARNNVPSLVRNAPEGIFCHSPRAAWSCGSCAGRLPVVRDVARRVRCGRAFSGGGLGQTKRRGRRPVDGTALQYPCTTSVTAPLQLLRVRSGLYDRGARLSATAKSTAFNAVDLGQSRRIRPVPQL